VRVWGGVDDMTSNPRRPRDGDATVPRLGVWLDCQYLYHDRCREIKAQEGKPTQSGEAISWILSIYDNIGR